jgi:4-hydroxybenzoate polyprenyltransferase
MARISGNALYALKASDIDLFLLLLALVAWLTPRNTDSTIDSAGEASSQDAEPTARMDDTQEMVAIQQVRLLLETSRWPLGVISALPILVGFGLGGREMEGAIWLSLSIVATTLSAFIYNDLFDANKDRIAGLERPICTGRLSVRFAWVSATLLTIASVISVIQIDIGIATLISVFTNLTVIAYSSLSRLVPTLKGGLTALLSTSPILLLCAGANVAVPALLVSLLFAFIWGRELVMDAVELDGDLRNGIRTLPAWIGRDLSLVLGWSVMLLVAIAFVTESGSELTKAVSVTILGCLLWAIWVFARDRARGILLTRGALLLGAISVGVQAVAY